MSDEKKVFPPPVKGGAKCRGCKGTLEGNKYVKVAGKKWHKDCAVKEGKKIPKEYAEV
jgi:hypothetical protein